MRITNLYLRTVSNWLLMCSFLFCSAAQAANFDLNVVDQDGNAVSGFRWLLQEDATFDVDPVNPATDPNKTLATSFHTSYHGLARRTFGALAGEGLSGHHDGSSVNIGFVPGNANNPHRYYLTVLPYEGYSISGAPVRISQNGANDAVTVVVQKNPIPTARISVYLFHDNSSINGAPDLPQEANPDPLDEFGQPNAGFVDWTKFNIFLEEPGGRYGIAGGQVIQDAFGNPLGSDYQASCDPNDPGAPDPIGEGPCITVLGDGTLRTSPEGYLLIEHLPPAKYGIVAIPPNDSGWQQSSTIEGTHVIDAWVKANEPQFFTEFGPPGPHVFIGFVKASADYVPGKAGGFPPLPAPLVGEDAALISGNITDLHTARPPITQFESGRDFPDCWIGLNEVVVGLVGAGLYAAPCEDDSSFSIPNVAPGSYELKVFDKNLDVIIATLVFTVDPNGGTCNNGNDCNGVNSIFKNTGVFNWFARLNTGIFNDENANGFWDGTEHGIGPESQDVTLRWRDGSVYQNFPTDNDGLAPFDQVFPFFHWLVAEVSFANKKATGATFAIDGGGVVNTTNDSFPDFGEMTPQHQCLDDGTGSGATMSQMANGECPLGYEAINPNTGDDLSWTEAGAVLTVGVQGFLGQTSVMHFGKTDYVGYTPLDFSTIPPTGGDFVGENGGISGIVFYATTRAENDPRYAAAEEWEAGVPRVQVELYADGDIDSPPMGDFPSGVGDIDWNGNGVLDGDDDVIDDANRNGIVGERADVDNYPFGNFPGSEDVDNYAIGVFDYGDALAISTTDSWDDNLPTGCQGETFYLDQDLAKPTDCFDGLRNFNQIRPAVFDGGYAFEGYDVDQLPTTGLNPVGTALAAFYASAPVLSVGFEGLIPGDYIIGAATPSGYEVLREEHKNVDFGDEYQPQVRALPVECVGELHEVPRFLNMQTVPDDSNAALYPDGRRPVVDPANIIDAPFAGDNRPLCDLKKVPLSSVQNAAAEFFLMTDVPVVANVSGVILNDLANEFDPGNPNFGEKYAPPLLPIGFYDWNGNLINRVYSDRYGRYNAVLPSTYTANLGIPSGMSPNMLTACMNDASLVPNPAYNPNNPNFPEFIIDPFFDPLYSQFCYNFQYMPGVITYLDTPVVPVGAFTGPGQFPVDCELPTRSPRVSYVSRLPADGAGGPFVIAGDRIRIVSMNRVDVPNPEWDGIDQAEKTIRRDYRFGTTPGRVDLIAADGTVRALQILGNNGWRSGRINARVPTSVPAGDYQVIVTHDNGLTTGAGVTLTVGVVTGSIENGVRANGDPYNIWRVGSDGGDDFTSIQDAMNNSGVVGGDMILVGPGLYNEKVIMYKPVKLQGWGAGVTTINARQVPTETLQDWRDKVFELDAFGEITRLPGQNVEPFGFPALSEILFPTEEGAGVFVLGIDAGSNRYRIQRNRFARIDGFNIIGASTGGGIVVNGHADYLQIGNNRLQSNAGIFGGGIRIGHPAISHQITGTIDPDYDANDPNSGVGDFVYDDAQNNNIRIHHNEVIANGGQGGAGGGISLHTGADNYDVKNNWVCGNFSSGQGGGIGHLGRSTNGEIEDNVIIFNETFNQSSSVSGGGIFVGGQPGITLEAATGLLLSPGAGTVIIESNLIRGNLAGAGDGGGIHIDNVNGQDIAQNLNSRTPWYRAVLFNNMVTNNVAALAAGGISIQDSLVANIQNNTVANNESTSTAERAFDSLPANLSVALPAGIVSRTHGDAISALMNIHVLPAALPNNRAAQWRAFSDPTLRSNFILNNRSFFWSNFDDPLTRVIENGLLPATCNTPAAPLGNPNCSVNSVPFADYSVDLGVLEGTVVTPDLQNPRFSFLTDTSGYHSSNVTGNPGFVNSYFNTARNALVFPEFTVAQTALAFDEGGNFIQVSFGPLSLLEPGLVNNPANNTNLHDYHITQVSNALGNAAIPNAGNERLSMDYDDQSRNANSNPDIGADEFYSTPQGELPPFYPASAGLDLVIVPMFGGQKPAVVLQPQPQQFLQTGNSQSSLSGASLSEAANRGADR